MSSELRTRRLAAVKLAAAVRREYTNHCNVNDLLY